MHQLQEIWLVINYENMGLTHVSFLIYALWPLEECLRQKRWTGVEARS
jgi:hypothetical protein